MHFTENVLYRSRYEDSFTFGPAEQMRFAGMINHLSHHLSEDICRLL